MTTGPMGGGLEEGFLFGVATAGFQIEGGYNGPGQPANNWLSWEQAGRVEPSGNGVGFWERPHEALDRAAALGCNSFRLGVEWARVQPEGVGVDRSALERYATIVEGCLERGLQPLVTLHHFTHPAWLGDDFWLRPDAPRRFRAWTELVVEVLAPFVRHWVTINEINVLALGSWFLGTFPPGRHLGFADVDLALDNLLAAHVGGYEVIHRARPDALVTTNNGCLSLYEYDRMLTDLLLARSLGVDRDQVADWLEDRRHRHDALLPPASWAERLLRQVSAARSPLRRGAAATGGLGGSRARRRPAGPNRALDAAYGSPHPCTLDAIGLDYYDPSAARHFRPPGHRTAGGRNPLPVRALWDDPPDPAGLTSWLQAQHSMAPGLPIWVVENGLCNRVRLGRSYPRLDGWDRPRYLRQHIGAVTSAIDEGVPVTGYWHWSLMDNYEWGSYEPRFGIYGIDRHRGEHGLRWLDTDAMGDDAAGAYRRIVTGLRSGDRSVVAPE